MLFNPSIVAVCLYTCCVISNVCEAVVFILFESSFTEAATCSVDADISSVTEDTAETSMTISSINCFILLNELLEK